MSDILPIDREKLIDDVKLEPIIEKDEEEGSERWSKQR